MPALGEGLYFGLDDSVYHSLPYLSASGIKNILVSPMNFWAWSWMNPLKPERDSDATTIGKAYHKRILEGIDAFRDSYIEEFDGSQYPEALKTSTEIQAVLRARGLPVGGNKAEITRRLKESDPPATFFDDLYDEWVTSCAGRATLSREMIDRIEIAAAMIEKNPDLSKCFTGGYPEVTVIWQENGIFFKSRFDYLKPRAIIDLKTFENIMGKPVDKAIYYAMASQKYHIQAAFYMGHAAPKAVEFARAGKVHGFATKDFLAKLSQTESHDFYFVFQQKGIAPVARGKKFPKHIMYGCGMQAIEDAISKYKQCLSTYGTAPWVDPTPIDEFEDESFPIFATDL